jgi:hypothetical protein
VGREGGRMSACMIPGIGSEIGVSCAGLRERQEMRRETGIEALKW